MGEVLLLTNQIHQGVFRHLTGSLKVTITNIVTRAEKIWGFSGQSRLKSNFSFSLHHLFPLIRQTLEIVRSIRINLFHLRARGVPAVYTKKS